MLTAISRRSNHLLGLLSIFLVLSGWTPIAFAQNNPAALQELVEAGFVTKFPKFVTWPEESWDRKDEPLRILVLGTSPISNHLGELANFTEFEGRPMEVRQADGFEELEAALDCQILFIAPSQSEHLDQILDTVKSHPILTVSDSPGFGKRGVHINFYREGEHVRFEINKRAANEAKLFLDYKLLQVADPVY